MDKQKEPTKKQIAGELGEQLAAKFLASRHFVIKDRNYRKKWGELDIIAEKDGTLHFVEVKSVVTRGFVSRVTNLILPLWHISPTLNVGNGVGSGDYFPEENVHFWKQRRMARAIQTYLLEKHVPEDQEWQIDIMAVFLDFSQRYATIRYTDDVVFDIPIA